MGSGLFQPAHLLVLLVIVLIIFGPGKLPELGSSLGRGIREFKKSVDDVSADNTPAPPAGASAQLPTPPPATTVAAAPAAAPVATAAPAATAPAPATATAPATTAGPTCPGCNQPAAADARFCTHCGRALHAA